MPTVRRMFRHRRKGVMKTKASWTNACFKPPRTKSSPNTGWNSHAKFGLFGCGSLKLDRLDHSDFSIGWKELSGNMLAILLGWFWLFSAIIGKAWRARCPSPKFGPVRFGGLRVAKFLSNPPRPTESQGRRFDALELRQRAEGDPSPYEVAGFPVCFPSGKLRGPMIAVVQAIEAWPAHHLAPFHLARPAAWMLCQAQDECGPHDSSGHNRTGVFAGGTRRERSHGPADRVGSSRPSVRRGRFAKDSQTRLDGLIFMD